MKGGRGRDEDGGTDERPVSDKPLLTRCREITVPGSFNLNLSFSEAMQKKLC